MDSTPTGPENQCWGAAVFHIDRGSLGDIDLSGVNLALLNHFPSNVMSGNWTMAIVVDEGASDQQAEALERILSGQEGGPFAEFGPLISKFDGMSRGAVSFSDGDAPSGSVSGVGDLSITPATGTDGKPTTVKNALFGFAPEFTIGRSSGKATILGKSVDLQYAETAEFVFASEGSPAKGRA